jgi:hypothetical protein
MSHWLALLPVCHDTIREPGAAPRVRKGKPGHRTEKHRRIAQEIVRAMRAEYDALPKCQNGCAHSGATLALATKYGISRDYLIGIARRGLRDDEREPSK